jgi:hypothetical protein
MTSAAAYVQLPPLFAGWMNDLFGGPIPDESRATCSDCVMCRPTAESTARHFRPDTKCCTFYPYLSNYSVGGILNDTSPESDFGRATVEARIDAKFGVTPLGLDAPPTFYVLYKNGGNSAFGANRSLRCPHYIEDGGLCGVWRYRNSVCSTWFCQVVRGNIGRDFWSQLLQLLGEIETTLRLWCVDQLDVGNGPLRYLIARNDGKGDVRLTAADLDGESDLALYHQAWGDRWVGRERELYSEAWRLVSALSWSDVLQIAGPKVRSLAHLSREAYADLISESMPNRLRRGSYTVAATEREYIMLHGAGAAPADTLPVLAGVVDILPLFDGRRSTAEVIMIAKRSGTRLSEWAVRQLIDFKILDPAP